MSLATVGTHTIAGRRFTSSTWTAGHLAATIARLEKEHPTCRLVILQTCYHTGVDDSAGTHDFDGAADPEGQSEVFGSPPQWDDSSDSTFAVLRAYDDGVVSFFGNASAPLIGNADGKGFLSFVVRWLPDNARLWALRFGVRVDGVEALAATFAPSPGGIRNNSAVIGPSYATGPYTWDEICTAIGEDRVTVFTGLYEPLPTPADYLATVYELVVTALDPVVPPNAVPPARRMWPRTDDLGLGSGRVWPPTVSPQYGNRYGAGAPL